MGRRRGRGERGSAKTVPIHVHVQMNINHVPNKAQRIGEEGWLQVHAFGGEAEEKTTIKKDT